MCAYGIGRYFASHTQCPGTIVKLDLLAKFSCHDRLLALEANAKLLLLDHDIEVARTRALRDWDSNIDVAQLLSPLVR